MKKWSLGFRYPFASSQNANIFHGLRKYFGIVRKICENDFSLHVTVRSPESVRGNKVCPPLLTSGRRLPNPSDFP